MTASELEPLVKTQETLIGVLRKQIDELSAVQTDLRRELSTIQQQLAKVEERLANHIAHVEKWDNRRWGTIGFFIVGLIALINGLILTWVRK